jgi:hypothetical protein
MNILQPIAIIVGVVSGVSGLVLGIANWWHQRVTTRPRLVVRALVCILGVDVETKQLKKAPVVEICNVGHTPVVGSTFGFLPAWSMIDTITTHLPRRIQHGKLVHLLQEQLSPYSVTYHEQEPLRTGLEWQRELPPQHIAILRVDLRPFPKKLKLGRAFATTIVGDTFRASRRDMRKFIKQCKALRQEQSIAVGNSMTKDDHAGSKDMQ